MGKYFRINDILCVEVPKDVTWWNFTDNDLNSFITNELSLGKRFLQYGTSSTMFGKEVTNRVYYNPETFYCCQHYDNADIIGKLSELTDADCEDFIDNYKGSNKEIMSIKSAKESFLSLLQSEGIDTSKEYLIIKITKA